MKIIIVGAGIAGLSAGIFARQSGFEVTIFEAHTIPGGNATGWKRNGYYFEGGMHWLVGSSNETAVNKLWHEVGALQENNPIYNRDPFLTYINGEEKIALYRDTDKLKEHLLAISPQDKKAINLLMKDICSLKKASSMPVTDLKGVKVKHKNAMAISQVLEYVKASRAMMRLSKISINDYVVRFKHEGIKELLNAIIPMGEYSAMSLIFTLSGLAVNDAGYPKGGSLQLAQNMANTFINLGGVIKYNKKVDHVEIVKTQAKGIWVDGSLHEGDAVIITSDALVAIDRLFSQPLHEKWMDRLRQEIKPVNCTFISLGVKLDMSYLPENMILPIKKSFTFNGKEYKSISVNNYSTFDGYAPKGCTSLTTILFEDTYDEWKQSYKDGTYKNKKADLAKTIIQLLEDELPEIKGKVEERDVATPLTYERFCGTFRGSWMSVMKPNARSQIYPSKSESIVNLYFAGQRLMVPGGMPAALMTSRTAVQHLCKDTNCVFQGKIDVIKNQNI